MPIQNIERHNVTDRVFEQLKEMIVSGEWKPGDKLPSETDLAVEMGVSRVSVRAAIQQLVSLGIVSRQQGRGTIVRDLKGSERMYNLIPVMVLSKPDLRTMTEFRMIIECGTAEMAAKNCDDGDLARLEENYREMRALYEQKAETFEADVQFHFLIAAASKNEMLIQTENILKDVFLECMKEQKELLGDEPSLVQHRLILDAIREHDGAKAAVLMREHLFDNVKAFDKMLKNK